MIHVGTSGYNYPEWKGRFYPEKIAAKAMLPYYAGVFDTVEINYTFYRMPTAPLVEGWAAQVPDGRNLALCLADSPERHTPLVATADYGYLRLRDEGYTDADLARWAEWVDGQQGAWRETFVYFKHEDEGKGPEFAQAFRARLAPRASEGTSGQPGM